MKTKNIQAEISATDRQKKGGSDAPPPATKLCALLFDALVVLARTRIYTNLVARVDEQGNLDRGTRVNRSGFERVGRSRITLDTGLGVGYLHVDNRGQLGRQYLLLLGVEHHLDNLAIGHQVVVVDERLLDVDLLEGLRVHEVGTQIILIGELIGATLYAHLLDFNTYRREGVLQNATILQILELRTNEGGTLARLAVLEIDYKEGLAVHLDAHADFDISCCNLHMLMCL